MVDIEPLNIKMMLCIFNKSKSHRCWHLFPHHSTETCIYINHVNKQYLCFYIKKEVMCYIWIFYFCMSCWLVWDRLTVYQISDYIMMFNVLSSYDYTETRWKPTVQDGSIALQPPCDENQWSWSHIFSFHLQKKLMDKCEEQLSLRLTLSEWR